MCDQVPEGALNLEQIDGFFAALIAGPEAVPPSEYFEPLWGADDQANIAKGMPTADARVPKWTGTRTRVTKHHPAGVERTFRAA